MADIQAILFDCDGVLLDSEPASCEALARAVTAAGLPMSTSEAVAVFCGHSSTVNRDWLVRAGLDDRAIFDEADRILQQSLDRAIPHVEGVDRVLSDFNVPMAVCSNSTIARLQASIMRSPLAGRFGGHIYSAQHVSAPKPAPELALFASRRLGVAPGQTIFIDDNVPGIRCGIEAGCIAVGFVGPSDSRPDHALVLKDAGAHHVVHGMSEFYDLLTRLALPRF